MRDFLFLTLTAALASACGVPCPGGINDEGLFVVGDRVRSICKGECDRDYGSTEDPNLLGHCFGLRTLALQEATGRLAAFDSIEAIYSMSFHRKTRDADDRELVRWELDEEAFPLLQHVTTFTSGTFVKTSVPGLNNIEDIVVVDFSGDQVSGLNSFRRANWITFGALDITGLQSFEEIVAHPVGIPPRISTISALAGLTLPSFTTSGWDTVLASSHGDVSAPVLTRVAGNLGGAGGTVSFPAIKRVGGALSFFGNGLRTGFEDTGFISVSDSVHALHLIISQTTTYTPNNFKGHVDVDGAVEFFANDSITTPQIEAFVEEHVGEHEIVIHCSNFDDGHGNCIDQEFDTISRPSIPQLQCQVLGDCEECERQGNCL